MNYTGRIILTDDISEAIAKTKQGLAASDFRVFNENDPLKIKDAREIIRQAHLTSESKKTIIIAAQAFGEDAQSALLKVLEEPPNNIEFVIITKNKNALLPTIRSRMMIELDRKEKTLADFELDLYKIDLEKITHFLKANTSKASNNDGSNNDDTDTSSTNANDTKDSTTKANSAKDNSSAKASSTKTNSTKDSRIKARELVQSLLFALHKLNIKLEEDELDMFDEAIVEVDNYRKIQHTLLPLLLMVHNKIRVKQ
ncbi:DNA polymerase III subunit delta' [Helicobacter fennelliae]|uniref:DNA poymerase III subunit delta n=1 Tax=Helicobacter fennelliae MRY12-0050 TaxID=1325130 RepID=T1CMG2_9HELI|nr:DNA polymerase III subunit delta' [Helicobacter fennelliae]GAD17929.1 DNA poymerase III subunit delta' [Helicobacter fennelliae MRY12-0050]STP07645.1 DNA polymerase III subunit delta' [Helicobacter fennelliae]